MFNNLRRTWHWEKTKSHSARIENLLNDRLRYELEEQKAMVLAVNYEIVSNATRAMTALRKVEEIGVPANLEEEVHEIRSWLKDYVDLPAIPHRDVESAPQDKIDRLYDKFERIQGRSGDETLTGGETGRSESQTEDTFKNSSQTKEEQQKVARRLERLSKDYEIPADVVKTKFQSYALTLRASEQSSHWNADVDDVARDVGALTEEEIERAKTNFLTAVVNRVKLALVMEGYIPKEKSHSKDGTSE